MTDPDFRSVEGVASSMRSGAKERVSQMTVKMGKLLAVANPAHGPGFLEEVNICIILYYFDCIFCN